MDFTLTLMKFLYGYNIVPLDNNLDAHASASQNIKYYISIEGFVVRIPSSRESVYSSDGQTHVKFHTAGFTEICPNYNNKFYQLHIR